MKNLLLYLSALRALCAHADWQASPECRSMVKYLGFDSRSRDIKGTDSFVVLKRGHVVFQNFAEGYSMDTPHRMWSASKLVANLIVARAIKEGKLSLHQKLSEFFPSTLYQHEKESRAAYERITIRDLLEMQSGIAWEELETTDLQKLSVVRMIYSRESQDVLSYILSKQVLPTAVGKLFNYSTADYHILSGVLRKVYGEDYEHLPWKLLFEPMGMKRVVVERDAKGIYLLGSNVYMSPGDLAKIGILLSQNGRWAGQQLLPNSWVAFMTTPNSGQLNEEFSKERLKKVGLLGTPFWLNKSVRGLAPTWPQFPTDAYMSIGFMGQNLTVIPSKDLLFVRFGQDIRYGRKLNDFAPKLFACLTKGGVL